MARFILLDSGVVGLLCSSPLLPNVRACREWLVRQSLTGTRAHVCELNDFEVRRELIRLGATAKLRRLDGLLLTLETAPVNTQAWLRAAEYWAFVRRAGVPTAAPEALDCDVVLAAVAATIGERGDQVLIATGNVTHFRRLPGIVAQPWETIS